MSTERSDSCVYYCTLTYLPSVWFLLFLRLLLSHCYKIRPFLALTPLLPGHLASEYTKTLHVFNINIQNCSDTSQIMFVKSSGFHRNGYPQSVLFIGLTFIISGSMKSAMFFPCQISGTMSYFSSSFFSRKFSVIKRKKHFTHILNYVSFSPLSNFYNC